MMITTTISCLENSDDQTIKQQAIDDFVFKFFTEKKSFSKFEDKFIITSKPLVYFENFDNSDNQPIEQAVNIDSDDQKNERTFTFKENLKFIASIAIILFLIAKIKYDFFPSEEQKKIQLTKKSNVGLTGMSTFSEYLIVKELSRLLQ